MSYDQIKLDSIVEKVQKSVKSTELRTHILDIIEAYRLTLQQVDVEFNVDQPIDTEYNRVNELEQIIDKIRRGTSCQWTRSVINSQ